MPLPRAHIERLERDLRVHEERLEHLRGQIARLSDEAEAHETIIRLGRDACVLSALGELHDRAEAARGDEAPAEFLRSRDVELPAGAQVDWGGDGEAAAIAMRLAVGEWDFTCVWDRAEGFSLRQPGASERDRDGS